ncbi:hypothetical protein HCN44_003619 [Aphidius gifuensis]|uniref:calcium/calmodulin-dependent protein kinase n=1 Tax=Aphidius gifuensis TaxID=684658 RepID=A0A834XKL5_APHGI|nr:hypothetical protein HCN44_003619 [Aphidius gifuensis]
MKLGDKMTTVKDVSLPPELAQRGISIHVAVDEESPCSSSNKFSVTLPEVTKSMLDISTLVSHGDTKIYDSNNSKNNLYEKSADILKIVSLDSHPDTLYSNKISHSQSSKCPIDNFDIKNHIYNNVLSVNEQQLTGKIDTHDDKKIVKYENAKTRWQSCDILTEKSIDKVNMTFECIEWNLNTPNCCEKKTNMTNHFGEGKIESIERKDSAIYLEDIDESTEMNKLKELTENDISQRITSSSSSSIVAMSDCVDKQIENFEIDNQIIMMSGKKGQSRYCRPRRESSGYMSNLSTFDDDRRTSVSNDVLQGIQGLQFIKERRRSSTKRFNTTRLMKDEESDMPDIEEVKESLRENSISNNPNENILETDNITNIDNEKNIIKNLTKLNINYDNKIDKKILHNSFDNDKSNLHQNDDISIGKIITSPRTRQRKRVIHQYSSPSSSSSSSSSNLELERIPEKSCIIYSQEIIDKTKNQEMTIVIDDDNDEVFNCKEKQINTKNIFTKNESSNVKNILPKSIKVYQLLSTQSEDRGDGEPRLMDRRISLQINHHDDDEEQLPVNKIGLPDNKQFIHADSSPHLKIPSVNNEEKSIDVNKKNQLSLPIRKLSSPGEFGIAQKLLSDNENIGVRPIYPYCPYSPYGSPQGSPGTKRRPLRESRRVSIDNRHGALQLNQYKLLDNIGQGSFGIVKLAYNEEDDTHYAMKILSKKKLMKKAGIFGRMAPGKKSITNPLAKVYREIALLKKLDHPNVVKLVEVLDDPDEDNLYLVFELVQKGEVLQIPTDKPLDENTARINFRDVVMGVEYLHYQRIVHRDIKPSNLLVDSDGRVKVADLGVSAELRASGELLSGSAGTPAFAAPETTIPGAQYSGTESDIWSMGVTLYSMVTGKIPWDGSGSIIGVQSAVRTEPLRFPDEPIISNELRDLITCMLIKDPTMRINLNNIKTHCWITNNGKEPLPSEADNCRLPVTVTDEEIARVVTRVPKLDTLILIKTMLKQHSFQNPFLSRKIIKPSSNETNSSISATGDCNVTENHCESVKNKTEKFHKAGRSNSAPDSYDWQTNGRQVSIDTPLTPVIEVEVEKR